MNNMKKFEFAPKPKITPLEENLAREAAEKAREEKSGKLKAEKEKAAEDRRIKEAVEQYFRDNPPLREITLEDRKEAEEFVKKLEKKQ